MNDRDQLGDALTVERAALDAVRDRVMNVVGHGLRTPMATVRGQVEVLARTRDEGRRDELINGLLSSTRRLERLLDDVLVAAGIETRLPAGPMETVDPAAAVRDVWADLASERELTLVVEATRKVSVQPEALRWMLRHVLDNALRYGTGVVEVSITDDDDRVVVRVGGDGPDVSEPEMENAFELFYRGHAAVMADGARLGVGLPVTRTLAAANGAEVTLRRRSAGGTETLVRLQAS